MSLRFAPVMIRRPAAAAIRAAIPAHETVLVNVLDAILDRGDRDPGYPFIDTKFSTITGKDFPPADDPARDFRGRGVIYSWIQGRGLEALAGHALWLPECSVLSPSGREARIARIRAMLTRVTDVMERIRRRNGGRLTFMMTPEGRPLQVDDQGRMAPLAERPTHGNSSDLFYAKGLFAAAHLLGRAREMEAAAGLFLNVLKDIKANRFVIDQQPFDPKNKVRPVPGRRSQGPWMLAIGGAALFYELTKDRAWVECGADCIAHLLDRHVYHGRARRLQRYDFIEHLTPSGRPWVSDGRVLHDTGHCLEFVGLALRLLLPAESDGALNAAMGRLVRRCRRELPPFFLHNFAHGFDRRHGGIRKAFDLYSRTPINDDMPWWNVPETMRGAIELAAFAPDRPERHDLLRAFADCSNAYLKRYVNPKAHCMGIQTRDARGRAVDVIPATPDADPGYHTGLSIIDCLRLMRKLSE